MEDKSIALKQQIRREVLQLRNQLPKERRDQQSMAITRAICQSDPWRKAPVVMSYMSFGSEADTAQINATALAEGKILALPKINRLTMELEIYRITDLDRDLEACLWGIREPRAGGCETFNAGAVDFILAPGVAFDLQGGRIGYGKGFYDRFIRNCKNLGASVFTAGLAFEIQLLGQIPLEPHDTPIDAIVTENGWYYCRHHDNH
ncbi:MAG: 5-formyltetrahydrofolate cyclo-ligase [Smithellaceae bacterium]|nr:5-formyltetrahydrofolate cyclo-ligase [Smithellaceae bacterium]